MSMTMNRILNSLLSAAIIGTLVITFSSCLPEGPEIPSFEEQLQKDIETIDAYLATNNIQATVHASGLRYIVHTQGNGNNPTVDSCVTSNYKGFFLPNGQTFDQGSNISFPLKNVIEGCRIGMPLLNEGDSATFYIPSGLAYGYYGYPPTIPRDANLTFGVKLLKVGQTYSPFPEPKGTCE